MGAWCKEGGNAGLCLNSPSSSQAAVSQPPRPERSSSQLLLVRSLGPLEAHELGNVLTSMSPSPRMYQVLFLSLPVPRKREAHVGGGPQEDSVTRRVGERRGAWTGIAGRNSRTR